MAKARSSQKSARVTGKVVKGKPNKAGSAKARRVKPARPSPAKSRKAMPKLARERKPEPVVEIPEIPPPLPAPIASFTF
jgi:hypothetical protein